MSVTYCLALGRGGLTISTFAATTHMNARHTATASSLVLSAILLFVI
jgi:hypothetical protein